MQLARSPKEQNILYRNNGDGTFTDVTAKAGLAGKFMPSPRWRFARASVLIESEPRL